MQVLILAAGKSTRLGALGATLPKPLVPICGYPPIEFVLSLCRAAGLRDIVVNLHHHADLLRTAIGDGSRFGVRVQFSYEDPDILGTGGAVVQARRLGLLSSSPVMILNGKVVADADLSSLVIAHKNAPHSTVATMLLREDPRPDDWAPVLVDHRNRVVGLRGQRGPMTVIGDLRRLMFTGIHIIEPALFDSLPADGFSDLIGDTYLPALAAGAAINTVMLTGYFAEHSTPERYLAGNLAVLKTPEHREFKAHCNFASKADNSHSVKFALSRSPAAGGKQGPSYAVLPPKGAPLTSAVTAPVAFRSVHPSWGPPTPTRTPTTRRLAAHPPSIPAPAGHGRPPR